jgi:hypothetical protein
MLILPVPASYWMRIICTETGHTLAPIPGDAWEIVQDSRPLTISAAPEGAGKSERHSFYFVGAVVERLHKADANMARTRFAEKAGFALPQSAQSAFAVYLTSNSGERDTIYVFLDKDGPVAGLACLGSCERTVTATVIHPKMEVPSQ